ncbi:MAG: hypothetical protein WAO10_05950 [Candidatus Sulfotelmatobacter sp.]
MRVLLCALVFLSGALMVPQDHAEKKSSLREIKAHPYYMKAERFVELSEADRALYTMGLMDGFSAGGLFRAEEGMLERLSECTREMDAKQVSAIITKYVQEHPETWHLQLNVEAFNALEKACPAGLSAK